MSKLIYALSKNGGYKLQIYGHIGEDILLPDGTAIKGFNAKVFDEALEKIGENAFEIEVDSPGGSVMTAFTIYDKIKSLSQRVTSYIVGRAYSAVTVITSATDWVEAAPHSEFLFHESHSSPQGATKDVLMLQANEQTKYDDLMLAVQMKKTGKPKEELDALMREDRPLSAVEALKWGFINKIRVPIKNETKTETIMENVKAEVTPEEVEKLQEEIEKLKEELVEARAKLKAYEEDEEKKKEEEVEALMADAREKGIVTDANEKRWYAMANADLTLTTEQIQAISEAFKVGLPTLPKPQANATAETKEQLWAEFKEGKITLAQHNEKLSKIK